jgi:predicted SAM-dependent methyltransferase
VDPLWRERRSKALSVIQRALARTRSPTSDEVEFDPFEHPREVEFDPFEHPRKLNVGCGFDKREGYLNVDLQGFHEPDLIADTRDLHPLPSDFYEELVAQDVLEHVKREDVPRALREWNRVLVIGGRLRIRTTDLISLGRWLTESDDPERHRLVVHMTFGTQAYEGDYHLCGFTELLLRDYLAASGFDQIEFGPLYDDWLLQVEAVKVGPPAP